MPWFPSTFRIMTSLFDHDLAPRVCQKKHGRSFRQETRWDREARPCRVPSMQGSWPHNRSVGAPSDGDIDGRSLQIEGAITWGLARGTARRRGQLRGADAGALAGAGVPGLRDATRCDRRSRLTYSPAIVCRW